MAAVCICIVIRSIYNALFSRDIPVPPIHSLAGDHVAKLEAYIFL